MKQTIAPQRANATKQSKQSNSDSISKSNARSLSKKDSIKSVPKAAKYKIDAITKDNF